MSNFAKNLALAFAIGVAGALCCFTALMLLHFDAVAATHYAEIFLAVVPHVHHVLMTRQTRGIVSLWPKSIVTLEGFGLHWYAMIIYGVLIFVAVSNFAGISSAAMARLSAGPSFTMWPAAIQAVIDLIRQIIGVLPYLVVYLVGRWIGLRCDRYPGLTVIAVVVFGCAVGESIDVLVATPAEYKKVHGEEPSLALFWARIGLESLVFGIIGLAGMWRGHRVRLAGYVYYLLRRLPEETRRALVDLAYDEAKRLAPTPS